MLPTITDRTIQLDPDVMESITLGIFPEGVLKVSHIEGAASSCVFRATLLNGEEVVIKAVDSYKGQSLIKEIAYSQFMEQVRSLFTFKFAEFPKNITHLSEHAAVVLPFIEGVVPEAAEMNMMPDSVVSQLATNLDMLHKIQPKRVPGGKEALVGIVDNSTDFRGSISELFHQYESIIWTRINGEEYYPQLNKKLTEISRIFVEAEKDLKWAVCHRDVRWSNLILDISSETPQVSALLDFGSAMWGFTELEFGLVGALAELLDHAEFYRKLLANYTSNVYKNPVARSAFMHRCLLLNCYYMAWVLSGRVHNQDITSEEQQIVLDTIDRVYAEAMGMLSEANTAIET